MANDNSIHIVGNLTKDPELRYTASGRGVSTFGVAVNPRGMNKQTNEGEEQVSFMNVVAWAELGENAAASLTKGSRVIVLGRLENRSYDDKEGNKKYVSEIVADSIGPDLRWATCTVERTERSSAPKQDAPPPADGDEPF